MNIRPDELALYGMIAALAMPALLLTGLRWWHALLVTACAPPVMLAAWGIHTLLMA